MAVIIGERSNSMHAIRIDQKKPLAEKPHIGHNRYHPDIAPVLGAADWEELVLEKCDSLDGQIRLGSTVADLAGSMRISCTFLPDRSSPKVLSPVIYSRSNSSTSWLRQQR
jgi:hypothetical protein